MLNRVTLAFVASIAAICGTTVMAQADSCSGHNHTTGTVVGAVGGGAIGSAVTHGSLGGVVAGAALGGLAGNSVARDMDCRHRHDRHSRYYYRRHHYSSY